MVQNHTKSKSKSSKSWYDVATTEELYQWMEGPLYNALWDGSEDFPQPQPLLGTNYLLGSVHVRQVRVLNCQCPDLAQLVAPNGTCQGKWERSDDRAANGITAEDTVWDRETTEWFDDWNSTFRPSFETSLKASSVFVPDLFGDARYEDGGKEAGFMINLPRNGTAFKEKLREMQEKEFIDK